MNLTIRQENKEDFAAVYEINQLAFKRDNEARLVELLRQGNAFVPELSLVATVDDKPVGHILFTQIKIVATGNTETTSLALAPMAVLPGFQGKGIGGRLILHGFELARKLNQKSVIVLGHKLFYRKFGFTAAAKWNIKPPFPVNDPENFMAVELTDGGLNKVSGLVKYPKEFEAV